MTCGEEIGTLLAQAVRAKRLAVLDLLGEGWPARRSAFDEGGGEWEFGLTYFS